MGNHTPIRRQCSPKCRQYLRGYVLAIASRSMHNSAEERILFRLMPQDEFTHLIDCMNAVQIAIALRRAPGKQAVPAKNEALRAGILFDCPPYEKCQLKSGALPRHPHKLAAE